MHGLALVIAARTASGTASEEDGLRESVVSLVVKKMILAGMSFFFYRRAKGGQTSPSLPDTLDLAHTHGLPSPAWQRLPPPHPAAARCA